MEKENITKNAVLAAIVISIIFLCLIGIYGMKYRLEQPCTRTTITDYDGRSLTNSTHTLQENDYVLQRFIYDADKTINSEFSFTALTTSNEALRYCIIDEELECLSYGYVTKEETGYEIIITSDYHEYLGVKCLTCNSTDNFTLKKELSGTTVAQITSDGLTNDNTLDYQLNLYENCGETIKFINELYLYVLIAVGLIFFILVGYDSFKDMLYKGWGG